MRVYVPGTWTTLSQLWARGELGPAPLAGCAVTPMLREWYLDDDLDELEYAAMAEAARTSLRLLARDPKAPRRRVVIAADVPAAAVDPNPVAGRAHVVINAAAAIGSMASVHVDEAAAADVIAAALEALPRADAGDEDAAFVVDEAASLELQWYATQEIPDLLSP
jgi:hypothetical protein